MTHLLQFTINDRKSRRQPQCTSRLVCEDRMFFARIYLDISYAGSSIQNASQEFAFSFVNFILNPTL